MKKNEHSCEYSCGLGVGAGGRKSNSGLFYSLSACWFRTKFSLFMNMWRWRRYVFHSLDITITTYGRCLSCYPCITKRCPASASTTVLVEIPSMSTPPPLPVWKGSVCTAADGMSGIAPPKYNIDPEIVPVSCRWISIVWTDRNRECAQVDETRMKMSGIEHDGHPFLLPVVVHHAATLWGLGLYHVSRYSDTIPGTTSEATLFGLFFHLTTELVMPRWYNVRTHHCNCKKSYREPSSVLLLWFASEIQ